MRPLRFRPFLKQVVWGGSGIGIFKGECYDRFDIGESWEVSGYEQAESIVDGGQYSGKTLSEVIAAEGAALVGRQVFAAYGTRFPLIVKIIDARRNLSMQVHPDDAAAAAAGMPFGKTEMWYILESNPYSSIYAGLRCDMTRPQLREAVKNHEIMNLVNDFHGDPGDAFFIPGGQIHAIGEGNLLLEVQQNSDCTYRVFDYGRLDSNGCRRALHIDEALAVMSLKADSSLKIDRQSSQDRDSDVVCRSPYFIVREEQIKEPRTIENKRDSFMILFCCDGEVVITDPEDNSETLSRGHTIMYPATSPILNVSGRGKLITVTL